MLTDMELKSLRSEMRRLSEMIDSWNSTNDIPQIERDLVLSKLRGLYDMVRFCEPATTQVAEDQRADDQEISIGLDLGDVLSLGFSPELELDPQTAVVELEHASEPAVELEEVAELVTEPETDLVVELEEEPMQIVEVVEAATELESEQLVDIIEVTSEQTPESEPEPESESDSEPESDPIKELEPTPIPTPIPASQPMRATLFGGEEPAPTSHRQRQQVIMSFYDDHQQMDSASVRSSKSNVNTNPDDDQDVFEELTLDTIVVASSYPGQQRDTAQVTLQLDAAPADESFGGDESLLEPTSAPSAEIDDPSPEALVEPAASKTIDSAAHNRVLGDIINPHVQILADSFTSQSERITDLAHRASVGSLRSVLGLNDRYLLMHDLFGDDASACDAALAQFDQFDNLDDCVIYIAENFSWNPDCAGAKFLMEMLERKFI